MVHIEIGGRDGHPGIQLQLSIPDAKRNDLSAAVVDAKYAALAAKIRERGRPTAAGARVLALASALSSAGSDAARQRVLAAWMAGKRVATARDGGVLRLTYRTDDGRPVTITVAGARSTAKSVQPVDCDTIYGGSVASLECDYDPYWDPTPTIVAMTDLTASAQSTLDAVDMEEMQADAEFADVGGVSMDCLMEKVKLASYGSAIGIAAGAAVTSALTGQVWATAELAGATWMTYLAFDDALASYNQCMAEAKIRARQRRG